MGLFNGGRFNLTVSLRYTPQPTEIAFLCDLFNLTSQRLGVLWNTANNAVLAEGERA